MPRDTRIQQADALPSYVDRIREHVERDEVRAARRVLAEALKEGSTEADLAYWAEVLAPAKVLGFKPADGTSLRDDIRWFDEHGRDYKGQWVAVDKGELLAHAEIYEDLRARLDEIAPEAYPLVHFVQNDSNARRSLRPRACDVLRDVRLPQEAEMTTYSTAEAPAKLGEILGKVRDGETIVLLQEGEAVAEIRPVATSEEAIVRQLEAEGILSSPGERPRDFVPLAERPGALARFLESRR